MIITRLSGGLGNQMFQYAAGLALSERHRTTLKLDVAWYSAPEPRKPHERYALSCFNITEQFATASEVEALAPPTLTRTERWLLRIARWGRLKRYVQSHARAGAVFYDESFRYNPAFDLQPAATYLHGNWQSERYFSPHAGRIRDAFSLRYPVSIEESALLERIASQCAVCVHVRRGDYLTDHEYARENGALGNEYYRAAMARLQSRHPDAVFYLFSDDPAATELKIEGAHHWVTSNPPDSAHAVLRAMSACRHFVIANSSLSWWAAWLGAAPNADVIAPDPWFAGTKRDGRDIVPSAWQKLPRDG